jgi:hypothetical protein
MKLLIMQFFFLPSLTSSVMSKCSPQHLVSHGEKITGYIVVLSILIRIDENIKDFVLNNIKEFNYVILVINRLQFYNRIIVTTKGESLLKFHILLPLSYKDVDITRTFQFLRLIPVF